MRPSISLSVVHETNALGSDGESIEVSPCTSDQMSTSSHGHSSCGNNINGEHHQRYIPNVKLRSKPNNRRWSEVCEIKKIRSLEMKNFLSSVQFNVCFFIIIARYSKTAFIAC
jgi:hypothetical protein